MAASNARQLGSDRLELRAIDARGTLGPGVRLAFESEQQPLVQRAPPACVVNHAPFHMIEPDAMHEMHRRPD